MRRSLLPICLLLAALALPALPAGAEEEGDALSPEERFAVRAELMSPPNETMAFEVEGRVRMGGRTIGRFRLAASAEAAEGPDAPARWRLGSRLEIGDEDGLREQIDVVTDAALRGLRGRVIEREDGTNVETRWERTDEGMLVQRRRGEEERVLRTTVAAQEPAVSSLAAFVLIARSWLPERGSWAVHLWDASRVGEEDKPAFERVAFSMAPGRWGERDAWVMEAQRGAESMRLALDPDSRVLLGLELGGPDRPTLSLVPGADAPADEGEEEGLTAPSRTAVHAAAKAALALGTGDVALLDGVIHWPTVYAQAKPGLEEGVDEAAYRALVIAGLEKTLTKRPRGMIEPVLMGTLAQLDQTPLEDGSVRVTFPPVFRSIQLRVKEIDGLWYLVELPR